VLGAVHGIAYAHFCRNNTVIQGELFPVQFAALVKFDQKACPDFPQDSFQNSSVVGPGVAPADSSPGKAASVGAFLLQVCQI
jgi:hypothetical protein